MGTSSKAPWFHYSLSYNNDYLCFFKFPLLIINNFSFYCNSHFLRLLFHTKRHSVFLGYSAIPRFKTFCLSTIPLFNHSAE